MSITATASEFTPPDGNLAQKVTQVYNNTWSVGNTQWSYTPDNMEIHFTRRRQYPVYMMPPRNPTGSGEVVFHIVDSYGKKMHYRFILYDSRGNEIFRSGLKLSDEPVQVWGIPTGSGVTYDVYISNFDDDDVQIQTPNSGPIIKAAFTYTYYTSLGIWGEEETVPSTDYGLELPTLEVPTIDLETGTGAAMSQFTYVIIWLLGTFSMWFIPILVIVFIRFLIYGKEE